jgi:putative hydrolase of HD superfamily
LNGGAGSARWVLGLFAAVASLKSVRRKGWVLRGVRHAESVADHSLAVAVLSAAIAASRGLDPGRAALIAVLHDIVESVTGDLTPDEKASMGATRLREVELQAIERVIGGAPEEVRRVFLQSLRDYEEGSSEEGRIVREVDKLEMALQALLYRDELGTSGVEEFVSSALSEIKDPEIRSLVEEVFRSAL